ncbi:MAG: hypothetical protein SVY53_06865 [Chloroflexota bacterium]|nr:hypothetical protein [Chloroflexota bacterium]
MATKGQGRFARSFAIRIPFPWKNRNRPSATKNNRLLRWLPMTVIASALPAILLVVLPLFLLVAYLLCLAFAPLWYFLLLRAFIRLKNSTDNEQPPKTKYWGTGDEIIPENTRYFSKN